MLLHGLTATRRYVVMGSRQLPKHGYRLIGYDARGHGESDPAPQRSAYEYADLAGDLAAVLDHHGIERAAVAGASMGAHTGLAFALAHPERVSALVTITPAFDGTDREGEFEGWDALADGMEQGGVEGFMQAWRPNVDERWLETATLVTRQRLSRHLHPQAVADALRVVPRSRPFESLDQLESLEVPGAGGREPGRVGSRSPVRGGGGVRAQAAPGRAGRWRSRASRRSPGRAGSSRTRSPTSSAATRRARCRAARWSRPPGPRPRSPGSCPSRAARGRARRPARRAARSGGGCPRAGSRTGACTSAR